MWLSIGHNWTFFAASYGWDVISGNLSKSAFCEVGVSLWAQISDGKSDCPFPWYQTIRSALFGFVTKHACDRGTEGQNYDSQNRASIAASRGKNDPSNSLIAICRHIFSSDHSQAFVNKTLRSHRSTASCSVLFIYFIVKWTLGVIGVDGYVTLARRQWRISRNPIVTQVGHYTRFLWCVSEGRLDSA